MISKRKKVLGIHEAPQMIKLVLHMQLMTLFQLMMKVHKMRNTLSLIFHLLVEKQVDEEQFADKMASSDQ